MKNLILFVFEIIRMVKSYTILGNLLCSITYIEYSLVHAGSKEYPHIYELLLSFVSVFCCCCCCLKKMDFKVDNILSIRCLKFFES